MSTTGRKFVMAIIALVFTFFATIPVLAVDTSKEKSKTSDLNDFGKWLYNQPNTDLDLVIKHQNDPATTLDDSSTALKSVQDETIPRRVAWLQRQIVTKQTGTGTVLTDSARTALRIKFCRNELIGLKDTLGLIEMAASKSAAEAYRKSALAKIDAKVEAELTNQASNASIDDLGEKLKARGFGSTINTDNFVTKAEFNARVDTVDDSLLTIINGFEAKFGDVHDRIDVIANRLNGLEAKLNNHMSLPYKQAHPGR